MMGITKADKPVSCRLETVPKELLQGRFKRLSFSLSHGIRIVLTYLLAISKEEFEEFMKKVVDVNAEWEEMRIRETQNQIDK
jgi:hypothetical protein